MPNGNQVALPVPGGYNPMKASEKGKKAGSPGQTCLDLGRNILKFENVIF